MRTFSLLFTTALASVTPAVAADGESGKAKADSTSAIVRVYDFIAHPALQVLTWPVQNILAPGVEFLTYPAQPPVQYFLEENVIERSTGLFRFGEDRDYSIYPTLSLASGTSSRSGATLRHDAPFDRDSERLVAYFQYYVNGDYRIRSYLTGTELWGTPLRGKVGFGLSRLENNPFYQPDVNTGFSYALNSELYQSQADIPLRLDFWLRTGFSLLNSRYGDAPAQQVPLSSDFFKNGAGEIDSASRGLNQSFLDRVWLLGLVRDTRNNENVPLNGSRLEVGWRFHDAGLSHDFHEVEGVYAKYFKLGSERYEITAAEERRSGGVSLNRFLRGMEYDRLRRQFFSRKVLVLQLYAAQSFEVPGNSMPLYGLQPLGNGTPLRAYPGSRYRHYAVTAVSSEYRFPILRIMDGTIFNEYGLYGRSLGALDPAENLRNSWGFGVRVREPDMFLFRVEVAFNGNSGAVLNINSDTPF